MFPRNRSLIIIPTYNEVKNVGRMINSIALSGVEADVLIIDDNSPDGTAQAVECLCAPYPWLLLRKRIEKLGLGSAYVEGFRLALEQKYERIVTMDCDFSHSPSEIKNFLHLLITHDLVVGSRYIGGVRIMNWPMRRLLLSYVASLYVRGITGLPCTDPTGGFNGYTRRALQAAHIDAVLSQGYSFQFEIKYRIWRKGMRMVEHPITFHDRTDGQSKLSNRDILEALVNALRLRLKKLLRTL